jgi:DNA-directed RNA polymerase subunit alpha
MLTANNLRLGQALEQQRRAAREEVYEQLKDAASSEAIGTLEKPVDELELSVRARKALELLNINTIGDLVARTEAELLGIKNFGQTSLDEIKEKLTSMGLGLRRLDNDD